MFANLMSSFIKGTLTLETILEYVIQAYKEKNSKFDRADFSNSNASNHSFESIRTNQDIMNQHNTSKKTLCRESITILQNKKERTPGKYLTNNTLNTDHKNLSFEPNSVLLEIGLNCLDIIKEDLQCLQFSHTVEDFLENIGKLYEMGYDLALDKIYPKIEFPISAGSPRLNSKIIWNHHSDYTMLPDIPKKYTKVFSVNLSVTEWSYIKGHNIDGRILFPAAGYLDLVWTLLKFGHEELSVIFEDCRFVRATTVTEKSSVKFQISVNENGNFEITEAGLVIVTGRVKLGAEEVSISALPYYVAEEAMVTKDIYKELRLRGYYYSGPFQSIQSCNINVSKATIRWSKSYVTYLDNLFQMKILASDTRLLYVPTYLNKLTIIPTEHHTIIRNCEKKGLADLSAYYDAQCDIIRSGGIEIQGLLAKSIQRKKYVGTPVLEQYRFVPNDTTLSLRESVIVNAQIILENSLLKNISCLEVIDDNTQLESDVISPIVIETLDKEPQIKSDVTIFTEQPLKFEGISIENGRIQNTNKEYFLIIASHLLTKNDDLNQVFRVLKNNGYIISRESVSFDTSCLLRSNVSVLTIHRTQCETIVLFCKKHPYEKPICLNINSANDFSWIPTVQKTIEYKQNILLYAQHESKNGLIGFANCLRREPGMNKIKCILLLDEAKSFDLQDSFYGNQLSKNMAVNVYKYKTWGTYRHLPLGDIEKINSHNCIVNQTVKGDLSSLAWLENTEIRELPENPLVKVHYSALNFKDVMLASGKINADVVTNRRLEQDCLLGFEYSGVNTRGKRVMGCARQANALATFVQGDTHLMWEVPENWSLEEAATVPVVYTTVIYALESCAHIKPCQSILIHSGAGGTGQAAIRYALHMGCVVFTTVGTEKRKNYIQKIFPELPGDHIGNSHDVSFEKMIKRKTFGKGVDIVLNSLSEEKLIASLRCVAKGGRFLEIGKYDSSLNNALNLMLFKKQCAFHGVMLDQVFNGTVSQKNHLLSLVANGIKNGAVKPLDRTIFKNDQVEQAFRYLASGKHMGKVLIEVRNCDIEMSKIQNFEVVPRYYCNPNRSYIIIGGLGGFGLELVDWLILRGARKFVLVSRNGIKNGYQEKRMSVWLSYGIEFIISKEDVSQYSECVKVIEKAEELGPVNSIFNLGLLLADALFENQTDETFKIPFPSKAIATKHFDEITRKLCPDLKDFVVFSSVSCGRGNPGQTNYGMANSVMERICEQRRKDGYSALAIQWGAIGEVGVVAEKQVENIEIEISGTLQQRISSCLEVMDMFLRQKSATIVSSIVVAEKKKTGSASMGLVETVASVLGIHDLKSVSYNSNLSEIGLDSMTAVEIKQRLENDFEIFLTPREIRGLTLARLEEIEKKNNVEEKSGKNDTNLKQEPQNVINFFECYKSKQVFNLPVIKALTAIPQHQDASTVFFIPGIEGFGEKFETVCKEINAHACILQQNYEDVKDTIFEMALAMLKHVEQCLCKEKKFLIVAFSYGISIALELVGLLESKGYTGTVLCIDGSPILFKSFLEDIVKQYPTNLLEDILILEIITLFGSPELAASCLAECRNCSSIGEKLEKILTLTKGELSISESNIAILVQGLMKRTAAIRSYTPTFTEIKSKVVLYKPTKMIFRTDLVDYGLSEICKQNVEIRIYEGDHHALLDCQILVNDINSLL